MDCSNAVLFQFVRIFCFKLQSTVKRECEYYSEAFVQDNGSFIKFGVIVCCFFGGEGRPYKSLIMRESISQNIKIFQNKCLIIHTRIE